MAIFDYKIEDFLNFDFTHPVRLYTYICIYVHTAHTSIGGQSLVKKCHFSPSFIAKNTQNLQPHFMWLYFCFSHSYFFFSFAFFCLIFSFSSASLHLKA